MIRCEVCSLLHLRGRCSGSVEAAREEAQARGMLSGFYADALPLGPPAVLRDGAYDRVVVKALAPRPPARPNVVAFRSRRGRRFGGADRRG